MDDYSNGNTSGPQRRGSFIQTPTWLTDLIPQRVIVGKERSGQLRHLCGDHVAVWTSLRRHWSAHRPLVWPCIETIALEAGYSTTKVKMLLSELEEVGAIRRLRRGRKTGKGGRSSNRYQMAGMEGPLAIFTEADATAPTDPETTPAEGIRDAQRRQLGGLGTLSDHELDPQVLEEDPPSQTQKRCAAEIGDISHENEREPITDPDTLWAAGCLSEALRGLSPDMEASTGQMVVQRVVDIGEAACVDAKEVLFETAMRVFDTCDRIEGWQALPCPESPVGFVLGVAEMVCRFDLWDPSMSQENDYWAVVRKSPYAA